MIDSVSTFGIIKAGMTVKTYSFRPLFATINEGGVIFLIEHSDVGKR